MTSQLTTLLQDSTAIMAPPACSTPPPLPSPHSLPLFAALFARPACSRDAREVLALLLRRNTDEPHADADKQ